MHSFSLFTLLAATTFTGSYAALIKVQVGKNATGAALAFNPNQVTAAVGDMIQFEFMGKNHSATQSSFAEPCTRQLNTALNLPGADSGFMPVAANATEIPTWTIQVNDASSPQWFFCNQGNHCNSGMVFSINAPTTGNKTFDAYLAKAMTATHPDPALNQTAPFTPAPAAGNSTAPAEGSTTSSDASPTEAPGNAAPGVTSDSGTVSGTSLVASSTGTVGLSLSSGGTAAADNASGTSSGAVPVSTTTGKNSGNKVKMGATGAGLMLGVVFGALAL